MAEGPFFHICGVGTHCSVHEPWCQALQSVTLTEQDGVDPAPINLAALSTGALGLAREANDTDRVGSTVRGIKIGTNGNCIRHMRAGHWLDGKDGGVEPAEIWTVDGRGAGVHDLELID